MQDPRPELQNALKEAMRSKDTQRRNTIRLLQSAIKQAEVDSSQPLSAEDVVDVLQKEAKRRRESINEYEQGGRGDLAEQEREELNVIEAFLPEQLSEEELRRIVDDVIQEVGATSMQDMGRVMGQVMERTRGQADGKTVNTIVRDQLSSN
jgi:hypothetical protein